MQGIYSGELGDGTATNSCKQTNKPKKKLKNIVYIAILTRLLSGQKEINKWYEKKIWEKEEEKLNKIYE